MRKNWLTTVAGVMTAVGSFPIALTTMGYHINNTVSLVMVVTGLLGGALLGLAAKGQDEHSTMHQVEAATPAPLDYPVTKAEKTPIE